MEKTTTKTKTQIVVRMQMMKMTKIVSSSNRHHHPPPDWSLGLQLGGPHVEAWGPPRVADPSLCIFDPWVLN